MAKKNNIPTGMTGRAQADFVCLDDECDAVIQFNIMDLEAAKGQVMCPACRRAYHFEKSFIDKLSRLRKLILAVRDAEDLLGNVNVAVTTPTGEVKVPYQLLLTRLNTVFSFDIGGRQVDFHFRIEPLNEGAIR
jgi:hypothetical protein